MQLIGIIVRGVPPVGMLHACIAQRGVDYRRMAEINTSIGTVINTPTQKFGWPSEALHGIFSIECGMEFRDQTLLISD